MASYYVNKNAQPNGDHEVHESSCNWLKFVLNKEYLGEFASCKGAVIAAKQKGYAKANGCYFCSNACHTA